MSREFFFCDGTETVIDDLSLLFL